MGTTNLNERTGGFPVASGNLDVAESMGFESSFAKGEALLRIGD